MLSPTDQKHGSLCLECEEEWEVEGEKWANGSNCGFVSYIG